MFVIIIHPLLLPHPGTCWLAAVLTVQHMWDTQTQVEVEVSVCTGCMQYVIKGYKCFTMLRRTTYKVRSQSNVSTTEISTHPSRS